MALRLVSLLPLGEGEGLTGPQLNRSPNALPEREGQAATSFLLPT
jgi:hypothetical protein